MVLFCHNTSQVEDEPYPKLLSEKGGRGSPFVVFIDAAGDVIAPQAYDKLSVDGFEETLGKINALSDLEQKIKAGDKAAAASLLIAKIKLGSYKYAEASAKRKTLPSESESQKKEIDGLLFDLRIDSIMGNTNPRNPKSFETAKAELEDVKKEGNLTKEQKEKIADLLVSVDVDVILSKIDRRDPDSQKEAIDKFLAMRKAGTTPKEGRAAGTFWFLLMQHGFTEEDVKLAEEGLNGVKKAYGAGIRKAWAEQQQQRLDDLKEKVKDKDK